MNKKHIDFDVRNLNQEIANDFEKLTNKRDGIEEFLKLPFKKQAIQILLYLSKQSTDKFA